jgi:hypothetical protein
MSDKNRIIKCKKIINDLNTSKFSDQRSINYLLMKFCSYMGHIFLKNEFKFGLDLNITVNNNCPFLSEPYYKNLKNVSDYQLEKYII